jgi:DNA-binding NarL/FixJ family response regulator
MTHKRITIMNLREIFRLYSQGRSKLSISEQLGTSRTTVIDYIKQFLAKRLTVQ